MHKFELDEWFKAKAEASRGGRLNAHETIEARKTALVVVDMQNYFVQDGMPACAPNAQKIVPNINRLAQATRAAGGIVVWIQTEALIEDPDDWANRKRQRVPQAGLSGRLCWQIMALVFPDTRHAT